MFFRHSDFGIVYALQPLRSFLFHEDVGVLSSIELAIDMDNDTEQEEKKKDQEDLKKQGAQTDEHPVFREQPQCCCSAFRAVCFVLHGKNSFASSRTQGLNPFAC